MFNSMDDKSDDNVDGNCSLLDGPSLHCLPPNSDAKLPGIRIGRGRASFRMSDKIAMPDVGSSKHEEMFNKKACRQEEEMASISQRYPNAEEDTSPGNCGYSASRSGNNSDELFQRAGLSPPGLRSPSAEFIMSSKAGVGLIIVSRGRGILRTKPPAMIDGSVRSVGMRREENNKPLRRPNSVPTTARSKSYTKVKYESTRVFHPDIHVMEEIKAYKDENNQSYKMDVKNIKVEESKPQEPIQVKGKLENQTSKDFKIENDESIDKMLCTDIKAINNGKGQVIRILNGNYGIAIVFEKSRGFCKVLFDIYDLWIGSETCADLGKTLNDVLEVGNFIKVHAIPIGDASKGEEDEQILYLATSVVHLDAMFPLDGRPISRKDKQMVSQDKINNFHLVTKVATQNPGSPVEKNIVEMIKNDQELRDEHGVMFRNILKKGGKSAQIFHFCFYCKTGHYNGRLDKISNRNKIKLHNEHECQNSENCLEKGKFIFQQNQQQKLQKHSNKPTNKREKEEQMEKEEFAKQVKFGSAGRNLINYCCFHCKYEGPSTVHFSSKGHLNHVKDCGTTISNCPENPQCSPEIRRLRINRDLLTRHTSGNSMAHWDTEYHRFYCLHCKEPFTNKCHVLEMNHTLHMSKNNCKPTCKMVLLNDEKYEDKPGKGAKLCLICNVKLESKGSKGSYKLHIKETVHRNNILDLLRKDPKLDKNSSTTIRTMS